MDLTSLIPECGPTQTPLKASVSSNNRSRMLPDTHGQRGKRSPALSFKALGLPDHIPPLKSDPLFYILAPWVWNNFAMNVKLRCITVSSACGNTLVGTWDVINGDTMAGTQGIPSKPPTFDTFMTLRYEYELSLA